MDFSIKSQGWGGAKIWVGQYSHHTYFLLWPYENSYLQLNDFYRWLRYHLFNKCPLLIFMGKDGQIPYKNGFKVFDVLVYLPMVCLKNVIFRTSELQRPLNIYQNKYNRHIITIKKGKKSLRKICLVNSDKSLWVF